jgi:hypothetical protein
MIDYKRASRIHRGLPLAIVVAAVLATVLSCYPVVFFGKSFVSPSNGGTFQLYTTPPFLPGNTDVKVKDARGSDVGSMMWEFRPISALQHHALFSDREIPLWNRDTEAGLPLIGQGVSMIGDPLHWIVVAANGAAWAWDVKFLLAKLLFTLGAGWLAFMIADDLTAGTVLAASSAFLGFFLFRFNHPAFFSLCYAPWILIGWAGVMRATHWRDAKPFIVILVLSIWMELNSGTAKEAYMLVVFLNLTGGLAFLLQRRDLGEKLHLTVTLTLTGVAAALLTAPFWLIFADALAHAYTLSNEPQVWLLPAPLFAGFFDEIYYALSQANLNVVAPSVNLLIGGAALFACARSLALRHEPWYVAGLSGAILSAALAFGFVPAAVIVKLPLLAHVIHIHNTFSCVLILQFLVLGAFGIREFRRRSASRFVAVDLTVTTILGGIIFAAYFLTVAAAEAPVWGRIGTALALLPLAALVALVPAARQLVTGPKTLTAVTATVLCLSIVHVRLGQQIATGHARLDLFIANPERRPDFSAPSPAVELLRDTDRLPYRTVGINGVMFPGYQTALGLESIDGPDPLINANYQELIDAFGFTRDFGWFWLVLVHSGDLVRLSSGLDMFNVRYVLTPLAVPLPPEYRIIGSRDLTLAERPSAWPRAFFTDTLLTYRTATELADMIKAVGKPIAAVQSTDPSEPAPFAGQGTVVPATDYRLTTNTTSFALDSTGPGVAVLGETWEPGSFLATLDGKPAQWFRIDHAFKGMMIPDAGHHTITFTYRPAKWTLALFSSVAGGALLIGMLAWRGRRRG